MEVDIERDQRRALIDDYQSYVRSVVAYLISSMRLPAEAFDEYLAAGYMGLVEAAERFDSSLGKPFKNYAFLRIRGAIIDSIRQSSELTGRAYRYAKALKAADEIRQEISESGQVSGLSGDCDPRAQLAALFDYAAKSVLAYRLSLSECVNEITTDGRFGENPEVLLEEKNKKQKFLDLIATLPKKERLVIEEYYFNDKTLAQIAEENVGLSKSWVSRLHKKGLARLQELCATKNISSSAELD